MSSFPLFVQNQTLILKVYRDLGKTVMSVKLWEIFVKALTLTLFAYWLHLRVGLNDWLGTGGFHLISSTSAIFSPLPAPWPRLFWWSVFTGILLMLVGRTTPVGCMITFSGLFYATFCDPVSAGALNMHFLFALAIISWSTSLIKSGDEAMSAWPAHLIRLYLVVVYFGSGWRKAIFGDWLTDSNALQHCLTGFYTTDLTRQLVPAVPTYAWTLIQYVTLAFELGSPLLFFYPPLRKWGVLIGCSLHLGIALIMKGLFYFSFQMLTFYIPVLIPVSSLAVPSSSRDHQAAT